VAGKTSTSWKPGQSGNPAGRPKGVEGRVREVLESRSYAANDGKSYTGVEAVIHLLLDIAFNPGEQAKDRISAAEKVVDRGYGKPKESLEVSGGMTPEQQALLDALRMTPHERRIAQAQDTTAAAEAAEAADAAADEAAFAASTDVADHESD